MQHRLTIRREDLLIYLQDYRTQHGYSPSLKEMAAEFKLSSASTVHAHLLILEQKGLIQRYSRRPRGLHITPLGQHYLKLIRPEVEGELERWRRRLRNQKAALAQIPVEVLLASSTPEELERLGIAV